MDEKLIEKKVEYWRKRIEDPSNQNNRQNKRFFFNR